MSSQNKTNRNGAIVVLILTALIVIAGFFVINMISDRSKEAQQDNLNPETSVTQEAPEPTTPSGSAPPSSNNTPSPSENSDSGRMENGVRVYGDGLDKSDQELISFAQDFVQAMFKGTYTSQEQLNSAVEPYMTSALRSQFDTVDWFNVPKLETAGNSRVYSKGNSDALVDVYTTQGNFARIYIVLEGSSLKVSDYGLSS